MGPAPRGLQGPAAEKGLQGDREAGVRGAAQSRAWGTAGVIGGSSGSDNVVGRVREPGGGIGVGQGVGTCALPLAFQPRPAPALPAPGLLSPGAGWAAGTEERERAWGWGCRKRMLQMQGSPRKARMAGRAQGRRWERPVVGRSREEGAEAGRGQRGHPTPTPTRYGPGLPPFGGKFC